MRHFLSFSTIMAVAAFSVPLALQAEEDNKVQTIHFIEDDAQTFFSTKSYELKHIKANDLAPFIKSAVIRYDSNSTVSKVNDPERNRQLLLVSTGQDMMPYVDEMVAALDRPGAFDKHGSIIEGTGITYGFYRPSYRSSEEMRELMVETGITSGVLDSRIRWDEKTGMFYFKDAPSKVADIKTRLEWLDRPLPQATVTFKIYEVRDSDLKDLGIDYLAWKNGPGLNLFQTGWNMMSFKATEYLFDEVTGVFADVIGNMSYTFGGMFTAPSIDFSFVRILQQNGRAMVNSNATLTVTNNEDDDFTIGFSPEYQNIVKAEDDISSVDVGGSAELAVSVINPIITFNSKADADGRIAYNVKSYEDNDSGTISFTYAIEGSNVVERNNYGQELVETSHFDSHISMGFKKEKLLSVWTKDSMVEQTIGIPFLCELPVLKYIFGSTTEQAESTYYVLTAYAELTHPDAELSSLTGTLEQFDIVNKSATIEKEEK